MQALVFSRRRQLDLLRAEAADHAEPRRRPRPAIDGPARPARDAGVARGLASPFSRSIGCFSSEAVGTYDFASNSIMDFTRAASRLMLLRNCSSALGYRTFERSRLRLGGGLLACPATSRKSLICSSLNFARSRIQVLAELVNRSRRVTLDWRVTSSIVEFCRYLVGFSFVLESRGEASPIAELCSFLRINSQMDAGGRVLVSAELNSQWRLRPQFLAGTYALVWRIIYIFRGACRPVTALSLPARL